MYYGHFAFSLGKKALSFFLNRPFPSSPEPLYQNEVKCSAFDMEMIFYSHANKTHIFHNKVCALGLILKVRVLELGNGIFNPLNPLSPNSDQDQFSPNNIHTLSRDKL